MKDALDIHRALLAWEKHHEIIVLRRLITTADEIPDALGLSPQRCLVMRMYESDGPLLAFLVRAGQTPPVRAVRTSGGVRDAWPAPHDLVNQVTDYAADLVAPLLLPRHVRVFVDRQVTETMQPDDIVYTATGDSGTALGIQVSDLIELSAAAPADLAPRTIEQPDVPGAVQARVPTLGGLTSGRLRR